MSRIHEALKKAAEENAKRAAVAPEDLILENVGATERTAKEMLAESHGPAVAVAVNPAPVRPQVDDFEQLLANCNHPKWNFDRRMNVFVEGSLDKGSAERFRTLRSRLKQISATRQLKRILITSSLPVEGKTFVSLNLAQSIARQEDKKVLLIDADLRAPRLHLAMGAPASPGLSEYLKGEADEAAVVQHGQEGNICLIPCGGEVKNPSELLLGERLVKLLDWASQLFDWVIIDSPPTLPVHDANALADHCDGVLFVVRAGKTDYEVAQKAVSEFRSKNLLGVVLNGVDKGEAYNDYYYGYDSGKQPHRG